MIHYDWLRNTDREFYGKMAWSAAVARTLFGWPLEKLTPEERALVEHAWNSLDDDRREPYRCMAARVAEHVDHLWSSKRGVYGW